MELSDPLVSPSVFAVPRDVIGRAGLHSGARWEGVQKSGRNSYTVRVTIDYVSLDDCVVNGLLEIHGLTSQLPHLTTFFEGEIIGDHGPKSGFLTGRFGASEADDFKHWARFPPFRALRPHLTKPNLNYCNVNKPSIFMRWKEVCVVPTDGLQNIHGASYAGFYYLCLEFNSDTSPSPSSQDLRPLSPTSPIPRYRPLRSPSPETPRSSRALSTPLSPPSRPQAPRPQTSPTVIPLEIPEEAPVARETVSAPAPAPASTSQPPRLRRASTYADAAAGRATSPTGLGLGGIASTPVDSPPIPIAHASPGGGGSTPKEVDHDTAELSFSPISASTLSSFFPTTSSTPASSAPSSTMSAYSSSPSPRLIEIPLPLGSSPDEFPVPSSPPLGGMPGSSRMNQGSSSGGSRRRASNASLNVGTAGLRGRSGSRGQGDEAEENDEDASGMSRGASGGRTDTRRPPGVGRRASGDKDGAKASEGGAREYEEKKDWGMRSWSQATMTGFYFFRHSEPYQELALTYVPQHRGGTQGFAFR